MVQSQPLVSVVIPTFNQRPDFLRATIHSVLEQPYANLEVIVSNNHSTNGTSEVLAEFSDARLRIVRPETFLPMVPHFAFAAEQARGELISFLPSDDLVEPDWLETLLPPLMASPGAVVAFGEIAGVAHEQPDDILYTCRNEALPTGTYSVEEMLRLLLPLNRTAGWLVGDLVRTDAYRHAGGMAQPGIHYNGDHALLIRLMECGEAVYVNKLVGRHRVWGAGEGKTEGLRIHETIPDVLALYGLLESSETLRPHVEKLESELARSKRRRAWLLSLVLLEGAALHGFSDEQMKAAREGISVIDSSLLTRCTVALAGAPLLPYLLRYVHGPARGLARKMLFPLVNRMELKRAPAARR